MMCKIGFGTFGIVIVLTRETEKFHGDPKVVRSAPEEVSEQQGLNNKYLMLINLINIKRTYLFN
jgi:hypothetical protein